MADYYQLNLKYPDGREVETVHMGMDLHQAIARRFKVLGIRAEIGDRLPEEAQGYWRALHKKLFAAAALGWNPRMDPPEGEDDGDD